MTRPYSEDLRERAVARYEAGETARSIAAALAISPSCASKWMKRKRETGSVAPGPGGGATKTPPSRAPGWLGRAGSGRRAQEADAVRSAGGLGARALPIGAIHDPRPGGGAPCARLQN